MFYAFPREEYLTVMAHIQPMIDAVPEEFLEEVRSLAPPQYQYDHGSEVIFVNICVPDEDVEDCDKETMECWLDKDGNYDQEKHAHYLDVWGFLTRQYRCENGINPPNFKIDL